MSSSPQESEAESNPDQRPSQTTTDSDSSHDTADPLGVTDTASAPTGSGQCQSATGATRVDYLPWSDHPRAADKTQLFQMVVSHRDGVNLPVLICQTFGTDTEMAGADAQLARRLIKKHPELFETNRRDGFIWVSPTPTALILNRCKHSARSSTESQDHDGFTELTSGSPSAGRSSSPSVPTEAPTVYARDRAQAYLRNHRTLVSASTKAEMIVALATERRSIDNRVTVLTKKHGDGPEYLLTSYNTRFNSESRALAAVKTVSDAFTAATVKGHRAAVMVTITPDPSRPGHTDVLSILESLREAKEGLTAWIAYDPKEGRRRAGHRPPNLTVLEWMENGLPHLHVVYFGVGWIGHWQDIHRYLSPRVGQNVGLHLLHRRKGENTWRWSQSGSGSPSSASIKDDTPLDISLNTVQSPRAYLLKSARDIVDVAGMTADDLTQHADALRSRSGTNRSTVTETDMDTDTDVWKVALYWAAEESVATVSPALRLSEDEDTSTDGDAENAVTGAENRDSTDTDTEDIDSSTLPLAASYEFVGVSRYTDLPGYVQDGAELLGEPSGKDWKR